MVDSVTLLDLTWILLPYLVNPLLQLGSSEAALLRSSDVHHVQDAHWEETGLWIWIWTCAGFPQTLVILDISSAF